MEDGRIHNLIEFLYGLATPNNLSDVWSWQESGDRLFTISSYYKRLLVRGRMYFPHDSIWIFRAPRKICLFVWLQESSCDLNSGKSEEDHLVSWCFMCKRVVENVDCLRLHCNVANQL